MRLKDKVAIVTGAAQGIGLACAERFVSEGAKVLLTDLNAAELEASARSIGASFDVGDAAEKADVDRAVNKAIEEFGRIDILVSNAGQTGRLVDFLALTVDDFDTVLRTNLRSQFLFGQAVGRHMAERGGGGVIINMSSIVSILGASDQVPYATSKGGVNQLTKAMGIALAPYDVRVVAVGPGTILTEFARNAVLGNESSARMILSRTPLRRCGTPTEIANLVTFLASDEASYITGTTFYADGGRLALNYTVPVAEELSL